MLRMLIWPLKICMRERWVTEEGRILRPNLYKYYYRAQNGQPPLFIMLLILPSGGKVHLLYLPTFLGKQVNSQYHCVCVCVCVCLSVCWYGRWHLLSSITGDYHISPAVDRDWARWCFEVLLPLKSGILFCSLITRVLWRWEEAERLPWFCTGNAPFSNQEGLLLGCLGAESPKLPAFWVS